MKIEDVIRAKGTDVVTIEPGATVKQLLAVLAEHGVGALVHYPLPAHLQPIYAGLAEPGSLPTTERLAHEVLSLPIYPELSDAEVEAVAAAVREALG